MAKNGTGELVGNLILLAVIVVVAFIFINWLKKSSSQKKQNSGVGVGSSGASGGASAAASGIGAAAFNAWTNLVKYFTQGQTLANLSLSSSAPANNNLIPYSAPQQVDLNQFAQPFNIGSSLYGLGGGLSALDSLGTSMPSSTDLLQTQPLQTFDMSGIGFPLQS